MPPEQKEKRRATSVQKPVLEQPTITSVLPSSKRKPIAGKKASPGTKRTLSGEQTLSNKKSNLQSINADDLEERLEEAEEEPDILLFDEDEEDVEEGTKLRNQKELDEEFERSQKEKIKYTAISTEQPIEVHWDHLSQEEKKLRKFDLDPKYGPAVGITRLDRWNRAKNGGLNPSEEIYKVLTGPERNTETVKQSLFHFEGL